jgi:hypothetical protein
VAVGHVGESIGADRRRLPGTRGPD